MVVSCILIRALQQKKKTAIDAPEMISCIEAVSASAVIITNEMTNAMVSNTFEMILIAFIIV